MQADSKVSYRPKNDIPLELGARIVFARKAIGLTQGALASKLGIHRQTLGTFENGDSEPGATEIYNIAEACEVSAAWLLTGFDNPDNYISLNTAEDFSALLNVLSSKERKKVLKMLLDDYLKDL